MHPQAIVKWQIWAFKDGAQDTCYYYEVADTPPVPVSLTDHELNTNADPVISLLNSFKPTD